MSPPDPVGLDDAGTATTDVDAGLPPAAVAQKEVVFTIPGPDGENDMSIENRLLELIAMAEPGSSIRISMFSWTRLPVARALVDAAAAGVDVRVVIDHSSTDGDPARTLRDGLGDGRVVSCRADNGCIGDGINHNKFFLFSATSDGAQNVVAQSSANLTNTQLKKHNNLVIVRDDAALYAGYLDYWEDLAAREQDLDYYRSAVGDTGTKAYFFPRESGDTIVNVLDDVDCSDGGDIRLAMAIFTDGRVEVARALRDLARAGCSVRAVLREPGSDIRDVLRGDVDFVDYAREEGDTVHSKYLLVDASYRGEPHRLVWTGSHNYTTNALRSNDETLLKIDDEMVFQAFWDDWETMRARAEDG